jgi:AcrR family transcriptional regulator
MAAVTRHDSGKAARILTVTRELVLRRGVRGVTIAEIAEKAHVGKGTVHLYFGTKEDLVVGLFARDFLAVVEEYTETLTTDPDQVRPQRLCPLLVRTALDHPFVRALQTGDVDMLGILGEHPLSKELLGTLGPGSMMYSLLPVWRRYQLARTDWALDEQAYALRAVIAGFFEVAAHPHVLPDVTVDFPEQVMAGAVAALLSPDQANPADVRAAAQECVRMLADSRAVILASIAPTKQ